MTYINPFASVGEANEKILQAFGEVLTAGGSTAIIGIGRDLFGNLQTVINHEAQATIPELITMLTIIKQNLEEQYSKGIVDRKIISIGSK